jgi:Leucine-rich repeat (LRR) protein
MYEHSTLYIPHSTLHTLSHHKSQAGQQTIHSILSKVMSRMDPLVWGALQLDLVVSICLQLPMKDDVRLLGRAFRNAHAASVKELVIRYHSIYQSNKLISVRVFDSENGIAWLRTMPALTRLVVEYPMSIGDDNVPPLALGPLAALTKLTELSIVWTRISDISHLAALTALKRLNLQHTKVSDISPLAALTELTHLNIGYTHVNDISPLAALSRLCSLQLDYTSVSDISPLTNLVQLVKLSMRSATNLSPLASLTALTELDLSYMKVTNISLQPLVGLVSLVKLHLDGCGGVTDISPLAGLTALTDLSLKHSLHLVDISPMAGLTALTRLDLTNASSLADISPLAGLTGLVDLSLNHARKITDYAPLSGLVELTRLGLWGAAATLTPASPLFVGLTKMQVLQINTGK